MRRANELMEREIDAQNKAMADQRREAKETRKKDREKKRR